MDTNELVMPFYNDSKAFTLGFEAGFIWGKMLRRENIYDTVHTENLPQIRLMCQVFGYEIEVRTWQECPAWSVIQSIAGTELPRQAKG